MSEQIDLADVIAFATTLSPWAHLATVRPDNTPDVAPVHPAWLDEVCWVMIDTTSVKARNVANNDNVALHWQVTEAGDGVEVWGTAAVHTDLDTKRRLWTDVFDYDLNLFAPGGPDDSPTTGFLAITPVRALVLKFYGINGSQRWSPR